MEALLATWQTIEKVKKPKKPLNVPNIAKLIATLENKSKPVHQEPLLKLAVHCREEQYMEELVNNPNLKVHEVLVRVFERTDDPILQSYALFSLAELLLNRNIRKTLHTVAPLSFFAKHIPNTHPSLEVMALKGFSNWIGESDPLKRSVLTNPALLLKLSAALAHSDPVLIYEPTPIAAAGFHTISDFPRPLYAFTILSNLIRYHPPVVAPILRCVPDLVERMRVCCRTNYRGMYFDLIREPMEQVMKILEYFSTGKGVIPSEYFTSSEKIASGESRKLLAETLDTWIPREPPHPDRPNTLEMTTKPSVVAACNLAKCGSKGSLDQRLKKCSQCTKVFYCCLDHQRADWPEHKKVCKAAAATGTDAKGR